MVAVRRTTTTTLAVAAVVMALTSSGSFAQGGGIRTDPLMPGSPTSGPGIATTVGEELPGAPLPDFIAREPVGDLRTRPFLYFRSWVNRPHPWPRSFLFMLLTSVAMWMVIPVALSGGGEYVRARFWRSLLTGAVAGLLGLGFARVLFMTEIGMPLALLVLAVLELAMLMGMAVSAGLVGEMVLSRLGLSARLGIRPMRKRLNEVFVGVALLSLLLLIPGIGKLPPIGIRLLILFAVLGLGGLIQSRLTRRRPEQ